MFSTAVLALALLREVHGQQDIVKPIHYNVTLDPDFSMGLFSGSVTIDFLVQANTTNITVHADSIQIVTEKVGIVNSSGHNLKIPSIDRDEKNGVYVIQTEDTLTVGNLFNLTIKDYTGNLRHQDKMGFCLNSYIDRNGKERKMAIARFKPQGARRAFPCFDEPHQKAKFCINIIRPSTHQAISNQPLQNTRYLGGGRFLDEFQESLNMSTYSVAFVITDYKSSMSHGRHRIFADLNMANENVNLRLEEGADLLSKLEDNIGVKYPLSKIDSIALPDHEVIRGEVNGWGLLSCKNSSLAYNLSDPELQTNALEMSQSYAEQWFGNHISPVSWNYTWLNEGLVYYYGYLGASLIGWDAMDRYVLDCTQHALALDSSGEVTLNSISNGTGLQNYKAGAIMRMLQHFVTMDVFQKAVRLFLQTNAFEAVSPLDLYNAVQRIIDIENCHDLIGDHSVNTIMASWETQAGYPIVNVTRNYSSSSLTVTQARFSSNLNGSSVVDNLWYIPLSYTAETYSDKQFCTTKTDVWMSQRNMTIDGVPSNGWIVFNKQQTGLYRVNYDSENWRRITGCLREHNISEIDTLNRAQLVDDVFSLAQAGQLSFDVAFNLSTYISREHAFAPIASFLNNVMALYNKLSPENGHEQLRTYLGDMLNGEAISCLSDEENVNDTLSEKLNRVQILNAMCIIGNEKCESYVFKKFQLWNRNPEKHRIPPNVEPATLCGGIRFGSQSEWDSLFAKYKTSTDDRRKKLYLNALGCANSNSTVKGFLQEILKFRDIDSKDKVDAFKSLVQSSLDVTFIFDFVTANFDNVIDTFPDALPEILKTLAKKLSTNQHLEQMERLKNRFPRWTSTAFEEPLQIVKGNVEFNERFGKSIKNWFSGYLASRKSGSCVNEFSVTLKVLLVGWVFVGINKYWI
ncbi:hypothetical protein PPYR_06480 [Photinus pyralis]|uniref:Aminopeptidase n=1 Tax=Photinus pyralis TaxID=7054 RepID=A0A5N4ATS0_PHOPY|nr:aminopeptidase N-like [Photinus pyralis]KAB0800741.1 hypothetical protein PPYR_06480 [Photinus pyralis]